MIKLSSLTVWADKIVKVLVGVPARAAVGGHAVDQVLLRQVRDHTYMESVMVFKNSAMHYGNIFEDNSPV